MIKIKRFKYNLPIILIVLLFSTTVVSAQINSNNNSVTNSVSSTSARNDTIQPLPYQFNSNQNGRLFLNDNKELEVIYDPQTGNYILMEKIGDYYIKNPTQMTPEEYKDYRLQRDMLEYSKDKINAISGKTKDASDVQKNLLPTYYVNSNFFESVFGGNQIDVNVQGSILAPNRFWAPVTRELRMGIDTLPTSIFRMISSSVGVYSNFTIFWKLKVDWVSKLARTLRRVPILAFKLALIS